MVICKTKHQIFDIFTTILSLQQPSPGEKLLEKWLPPFNSEIMTRVAPGLPASDRGLR